MPWTCCGTVHLDDAGPCTSCGKTKSTWTVRFDKTRVFSFGSKRWIELELVDSGGAPIVGEPYLVVTPKGEQRRGVLDDQGRARLRNLGRGPCEISFPEIDRRAGRYAFAATPAPKKAPPPELHWLEIELFEEGEPARPVAGEPYEVRTPDRSVREGKLDERGRARLEDVPPGTCEVRFPLRDARDAVFQLASVAPPTPEERHRLGWIELELCDDRDPPRPVAGEPYVVVCSDGSRREGVLDAKGRARVEEIPPGTCDVWFPERDQSEGIAGFEVPPESPPAPGAPPVGWLELELVDDADPPRPMADEPYVVHLPDGSQVEGTLDEQGRARLDDLPCGLCRVEFPERDARDGLGGFDLPALVAAASEAPPAAGWLELELVEEGDPARPAANEPFRVELSDGSAREGRLDAQGRARLEDLPLGACEVQFPERAAADLRAG